jgi:putative SOS response-associated peptidase YedK
LNTSGFGSPDFVVDIHYGMPVIVEERDLEPWERGDTKDAAALMKSPNDEHPATAARIEGGQQFTSGG